MTKMILLVAATFLAIATSELATSLEEENQEIQGSHDLKNDKNFWSNDTTNSIKSLTENESQDYDQSGRNNWLDAVPGVPGKDYPNLVTIPETSFTCADKKPGGYYADVETRCQVFHVCNVGGVKNSFLCPPSSIFNQKYLVCDWWYDFECENARDLYTLNDSLNREEIAPESSQFEDFYTGDKKSTFVSEKETSYPYRENNWVNNSTYLSLASTGEGGLGYSKEKSNSLFSNYQTDSNEGTKFRSRPAGNSDLVNQSERQTTLNNYRGNDLPQKGPGFRGIQSEVGSVHFSPIANSHATNHLDDHRIQSSNRQAQSADHSPYLKSQFSDNVPRGFAFNYGQSENNQYQNINNGRNERNNYINSNQEFEIITSSVSNNEYSEFAIPKGSNSGNDDEDFRSEDLNKNGNVKKDEEVIFYSDLDEDKFDRQRQKEVDNTILNKENLKYENADEGRFGYQYDLEETSLTFEKPPAKESANYFNSEDYSGNESSLRFLTEKKNLNTRFEDYSENRYSNVNIKSKQLRLSGGFRDGPGNGFPSPNKELVGSVAIAGTTARNSNLQIFGNKCTDYSDTRPSAENYDY